MTGPSGAGKTTLLTLIDVLRSLQEGIGEHVTTRLLVLTRKIRRIWPHKCEDARERYLTPLTCWLAYALPVWDTMRHRPRTPQSNPFYACLRERAVHYRRNWRRKTLETIPPTVSTPTTATPISAAPSSNAIPAKASITIRNTKRVKPTGPIGVIWTRVVWYWPADSRIRDVRCQSAPGGMTSGSEASRDGFCPHRAPAREGKYPDANSAKHSRACAHEEQKTRTSAASASLQTSITEQARAPNPSVPGQRPGRLGDRLHPPPYEDQKMRQRCRLRQVVFSSSTHTE